MKLLVGQDIGTYTFSAATKTITFTGIPTSTKLEQFLSIFNVTKGKLLYIFGDPDYTAVSWSSSQLVLNADCTGMSDTDRLMIFVTPSKYTNPDTFRPRGHMFNIVTRNGAINTTQYPLATPGFDNFCLIETYPTSNIGQGCSNEYPNGYNVAIDSSVSLQAPNNHGIYMAPRSGKTMFIDRINLIVEVANQVDVAKDIDRTGATLQLSHSGQIFCESKSMADLMLIGEGIQQLDSVFTSHFTTYIIPVICKPAGMFNGTNGDYFQLKSSNGKAFASDYIAHFYASFVMWEVSL